MPAGRTKTEQRPAGTNAWQRSERSLSNLQDEETFTGGGRGLLSQPNTQTWGSLTRRINANPFHRNSETRSFIHISPKTMQPGQTSLQRTQSCKQPCRNRSCQTLILLYTHTHARQFLLNDTWNTSGDTREPAEASQRPVFK